MKKTEIGAGGVAWGPHGVLGGVFESFSKTPMGQAILASINIGVYELAKQIGAPPAEGAVVAVQGGSIVLNLGEDSVAPGDLLQAISKGEEFIDPDTGLPLGSEDTELGALRVTRVAGKLSYAEALDFEVSILARGDRVKSTKQAPDLQFAAPWTGGDLIGKL